MKKQFGVCLLLATGLLVGCATENESALQKQAKISKEDAQATALARVPNGTVKESELEKEHGRVVWSVALTTSDSNVTEVDVDAVTGVVVKIEHEKGK